MYETIDTSHVISQFHLMMQPQSGYRVMRLIGDGNMGKSHLLRNVLPVLAREDYHAQCCLLDVRNPLHTIPDHLSMARDQLGQTHFKQYSEAHQSWTQRPKIHITGLLTTFSRVAISAKDAVDDTRSRDRDLTTAFVRDLAALHDHLLLLFVDNVSEASELMKAWLMDTLLIPVALLPHVRVILAGRVVPEAHGSYAHLCQSFTLQSVTDVDEYITFCHRRQISLAEQSIRDFAKACRYTPGLFAELVLPAFCE